MKSLSKFLPLSITFLLFSIVSFAQDTVKIINDSTAKIDSTYLPIAKQGLAFVESKWVWVVGVLGFIVLLDHILAAIPSVKANSTFQLIGGWINALTGGSKNA